MDREGPALETLTRRLAECPADFLADPRLGKVGVVPVAAVVSDLICELGGAPLTRGQAATFQVTDAKKYRNYLSLALIACWLLHDAAFRRQPQYAEPALAFLNDAVRELAANTAATKFVSDPDRREELARVCLKGLGLRPAGESAAQAQDRLATLNTAERQRVIRAARQAEERARSIREAMARQAAQEAADKATRE